MNKILSIGLLMGMFAFAGMAGAAMMGGSGSYASPGTMMGGSTAATMMGGTMMTNTGGFGMMNGMAGSPVVDSDGTVYMVTMNPTVSAGPVPNSNSFQSTVSAVTPSGQISTITLNGIVSRPVVDAGMLVATSSLPNAGNYSIVSNLGTSASQSVLYAVRLPLTSSSVPLAVTLDGQFASMPVIANNQVYVMTTDFGNAMMQGNTTFSGMYGNFNFNSTSTARTYLYIIGFDGNLINKIQLQ